ncbi:MAG: N-acetylmuramoyl-L-alanine amidase [Caulobacterales bacterium]|nr:N-acetylmuramoyl-L-alanine amidase [Caulobacterales bacterium]
MKALTTGGVLAGWRGFAALSCLGLAVLTLGGVARGSATTGLLKVRLGGDQTETRVVLDLDRSVTGKLDSDGADGRVVLSLPRIDTATDLRGGGQGLVRRWNVERGPASVKLHLELARNAEVRRRFLLPPGDGVKTYRYVLDLKARPGVSATDSPVVMTARLPTKPAPVRVRAPVRGGLRVVVIDPGHGGKDPGAPGRDAHEKDITLAAAKALKARLEKTGRYRVVLTRTSDVYIPLESRVQIARGADADLFISLHADSGPTTAMRGASVYTLSERGESRVTRVLRKDDWLMPASLPGADRTVGEIILDLTQRSTRNRSAEFAELLLTSIADETTLLRRSHRDGNLMVLLAPDVPAVLLEMGFINNAEDERQLTDPAKRNRLMNAVGDAVDAWFNRQVKVASR